MTHSSAGMHVFSHRFFSTKRLFLKKANFSRLARSCEQQEDVKMVFTEVVAAVKVEEVAVKAIDHTDLSSVSVFSGLARYQQQTSSKQKVGSFLLLLLATETP